jgi:hypothetical protein
VNQPKDIPQNIAAANAQFFLSGPVSKNPVPTRVNAKNTILTRNDKKAFHLVHTHFESILPGMPNSIIIQDTTPISEPVSLTVATRNVTAIDKYVPLPASGLSNKLNMKYRRAG